MDWAPSFNGKQHEFSVDKEKGGHDALWEHEGDAWEQVSGGCGKAGGF